MPSGFQPSEEPVEPQSQNIVLQVVSSLLFIITNYGWHCLILSIACAFAWRKYSPSYHQWRRRKEEEQEAALYHKNPDLLLAKEAAIEKARQRLQEQYSKQSAEHAERQRLRDEEKKKEKVKAHEALVKGTTSRPKTTFKSDYNPLLGDGGSCSYRPARRGRAGG